ncbi:MAG: FlgD immunoglobulin-like domain containing protein [Candidatus Zixiibacteriota bacterium]
MFRSAYIILVLSLLLITLAAPALADKGDDGTLSLFYDPTTENEVTGPPPNYQIMDPTYFYGAPPFDIIDRWDVGGYNVYYDTASDLWNVNAVVHAGASIYEQIHGSVLIQLDPGATPEMVVQPVGFEYSDDLTRNDRWGYVKYPEDIAPNLYEIWWDITVDFSKISTDADYFDTVGVSFSGCAFDFNLWASGGVTTFDADNLFLGKRRIPISYVPNFVDTHEGIYDASTTISSSINSSLFTPSDLPGASFDANGLISADKDFSGSFVYEGDGIEFSVTTCPPNSNNPPYFYWPGGTVKTVGFCNPEPIYDTIKVLDADVGDTLTLTKISGPGEFETVTGPSPVRGYYSWMPTEAGTFVVVYQVTDIQGHTVTDSITYIITLDNTPPIANDIDTTITVCDNVVNACLFVDAYDPDGNPLTYRLLGDKVNVTIDENTGELCLTTYASGVYEFEVEVSDICSADTALVTFTVTTNNPPHIVSYDSTVYLCGPDTICFDVNAYDDDIDDSLIITQLTGPGIFTLTGNGTGQTCFLPDNVDSARYVFTYQVTDECLRGDLAAKCPQDSIVIIVLMGQKPLIACPEEPLKYELCEPATICVPIPVTPADAAVSIISGNASYENGELCIDANETGIFDITIVASGECGADTCTVTLDIDMGAPPVITCPEGPITASFCEADTICVDLPISPLDATVTILESGAIYENGKLCYYAEEAGTATFMVIAAGECGADTCSVTFDVTIGEPPVITCPEEPITASLCEADTICVDLPISPLDAPVTILESGAIYENGKLCYYAETAGAATFTVIASGECGADTCSVTFDVSMGEPPVITCPTEPITASLCEADTICVDLPISPLDATVTVLESGAVYENGKLCYFAEEAGSATFTVIASGECGADTCSVTFDVTMGEPPQLSCPENQTIHLCEPGTVSVPLGVIPPSADIFIIPEADFADGMLSFYADTAGSYCFVVSATTECGETECDFCITVTIDSPPQVTIEGGQYFQCDPAEICLPVSYSDADDNISEVSVEPSGYEIIDGNICFTPDAEGSYEFIVTITDECGNTAADTALAVVIFNQIPTVSISDTTVFLCEPAEVCVPFSANDYEGELTNLEILPSGYISDDGLSICRIIEEPGEYPIVLIAHDACGDTAVAFGTITATFNSAPYVTAPPDTTISACTPQEICLSGFEYGDIDDNIVSVAFTPDLGTFEGDTYCFTPITEGETCIVMSVTDACGYIAVDTFCVTYTIGDGVAITCPEIQFRDLCEPGNVCVAIPIEPSDAVVSILESGATYDNGELCFYAEESGEYTFTVIAASECGSDTCDVMFNITVGNPPVITCPTPDPVHLCAPDSISVPLGVLPPDAQITISPEAVFDGSSLTFYADTEDDYCFTVIAETDCGADTCNFCVAVTFDAPPTIVVTDSSVYLCELTQVCIPYTVEDPDGNLVSVTVFPDMYDVVDGQICFTPSVEGLFEFLVTATDECGNTDIDTGSVMIGLNQAPEIAIDDTTLFLCEPTDVCIPIVFSDPDGTVDSVTVEAPAYVDFDNALVCFPISEAGEFTVTVTVYDDCGIGVSESAIIAASLNSAPELTLGEFETSLCELSEICVPFSVSDVDNNINLISLRSETDCTEEPFHYHLSEGLICFTPSDFGACTFTAWISDSCGAADTVVLEINIEQSENPNAQCPGDTTIFLCEPGQLCLELGDLVPGTNFRFEPASIVYYPETNRLCYNVTGPQTDTILVIDSTDCGLDSCSFIVTTRINSSPVIAVEEPQEITFCDSTLMCIDVTISDPDNNIQTVGVSGDCPGAYFDDINSRVCIPITEELHCIIELIAVDDCNKATKVDLPIDAVPNRAPVIHPPSIETVVQCVTEIEPVVISNICVTDPDYDNVTLVFDSGLGEFAFNETWDCGTLTFTPPTNDTAEYCFRFMAYDACDTVYETFCIDFIPTPVCGTCVDVAIEGPANCANNGTFSTVNIMVEAPEQIAGFDLLLTYDETAIQFVEASKGSAIGGWEYFTYRTSIEGNCNGCPSGIIRLVAIADVNNGASHPPESQYNPDGQLASLTFYVSANVNYGGQNVPISFFWNDCGDNSLSDRSGQYLYIDKMVFSREGNILWDETDDINYPESARLSHVGAPDECLEGDKEPPVRCADFRNGELCIIHPDSIDARGDLNLNGIAYEIADAVVYTNFFIIGLDAFNISIPGQIAASDINADGTPLTIADLVLLTRIITGDAPPIPRMTIDRTTVAVESRCTGTTATVGLSSETPIGAALFVFEYDGNVAGTIALSDNASQMSISSIWKDGEVRVLLYSLEQGHMIDAGESKLFTITMPENSTINLIETEMADYYANNLATAITNRVLPTQFTLSQNYPNPFNPTTTFRLSLPYASEYHVTIYNVTGQVIRTWNGEAEAGEVSITWDGTDDSGNRVASGIYLYKAQAAGEEAIRKMVLLK